MKSIDRAVLRKMGEEWRESTPGLRAQAFASGRKVLDIDLGKTYPYYDWASVTKIVFAATALMFRHDESCFRVTDPVHRWVPWFPERSGISLRQLQSHSAGLTWWYPFYKALEKKTDSRTTPENAWEIFQTILKRRILRDMKNSPKSRALKAVYSDLDLFVLGNVIEALSDAKLYDVWSQVRERMNLKDTDFHRGNRPRKARGLFAPTENDLKWRGRVLQGEVHDQNTWALKGVAPHAGLFGPIDDLSKWGLLLRSAMRGENSKRFPSSKTVRLFTKRAIPRARGDWALGFMMPAKTGSSTGPLFSSQTVGHLGYTGTSLWYDPKNDLLVTVLSNRIHPTVENIEIRRLRPRLHTWIAESL